MIFMLIILLIELCMVLSESSANTPIDPKIEESFIVDIRKFLQEEKDILKKLKDFKTHVETNHYKVTEDKYTINEFLIVKRLVMDWHFITAVATSNKHKFVSEIQKDVSIIQQHPDFPTLSNLTATVLEIAEIQEKQEINSIGEFLMALANDPYIKLTASECSVFAEVLKRVNKDTLAKSWEMESRSLQALVEDPLMEIYAIKK